MIFPNWFKDVEKYFRHVPKVPLRVLQIGTYTGDATEWLLNNRTIERIHDVDTWQGSVEVDHESIDFSEVEKYYDSRITDDRVTKFKMTSDEFFIVNEMSYNFIYIDGDHTASQTALDGLNAFKWLETGGVMAFDDYLWNYNGNPFLEPKRGVDAVLEVCKGQYVLIESGYQVWIKKC
jgi:predicted O-methyltransferase YrrM